MTTALGRRLWLIVGGALTLTAVLVFFSGRTSTARVAVTEVARENLSSEISSNGKVEPEMPRPFRADFSGFVEHVYAREGQQVKKGQLIFTLDDKEIRAQLEQARADLDTQEAALRVAKAGGQAGQLAKANADLQKAQANRDKLHHDEESLEKLVSQKAATTDELEKNRLMLTQAEADVQSLAKMKSVLEQQAHLDSEHIALLVEHARTQVSDLTEKEASARGIAPIDGTLYSLPIYQGDFVTEGVLLGVIADLHHVRVRAFIDEPELGQLDVHQPVEILWDAHPDITWTGQTEVVPKQVVNRGARSVGELLCTVKNDPMYLLPNTTVDVRIHINEHKNVLVVARGAVYFEGDTRFVFRVENGRLHRRYINVGIADPTKIEVLSGLKEGDMVALPGDVSLKENLRIRAVRSE